MGVFVPLSLKMKIPLLFAASVFMASSTLSQGVTLLTETFTYPNGNLVGQGGWTAHSGAGAAAIQVTGGQAVFAHGTGSREDANVTFAAQTIDIVVAIFDFSVSSGSAITNADNEYFAHLGTGATTFLSRIDIVAPTSTGNYTVGIAGTGGAAEAVYATDLLFGTTYTARLAFNLGTGVSSLSINGGPTILGTSVSTGATIDAFYLRQSDSAQDETITIDNLEIQSVPEPTISLLGALGVLGLLRRRR